MATELDPGPITPAMGFLVGGGWLDGVPSIHHLDPSLSSLMEMRESRMNSMLCSRATDECQHESRISQPRLMFGSRFGSELIRSNVWNIASILWMPYCSRTSPHFLSATFSADGWWWTEKSAPMITSPSIRATERDTARGTADRSYMLLWESTRTRKKNVGRHRRAKRPIFTRAILCHIAWAVPSVQAYYLLSVSTSTFIPATMMWEYDAWGISAYTCRKKGKLLWHVSQEKGGRLNVHVGALDWARMLLAINALIYIPKAGNSSQPLLSTTIEVPLSKAPNSNPTDQWAVVTAVHWELPNWAGGLLFREQAVTLQFLRQSSCLTNNQCCESREADSHRCPLRKPGRKQILAPRTAHFPNTIQGRLWDCCSGLVVLFAGTFFTIWLSSFMIKPREEYLSHTLI